MKLLKSLLFSIVLCFFSVSAVAQNDKANLNPNVLKLAYTAYGCAVSKGVSNPKTLTIIDYSLPDNKKRLWVIDVLSKKVLFNSLVAHGKGSGDLVPKHFSNSPQSHMSSLGLFLTDYTYHGQNGYSLRLQGLEKGFNDMAFSRAIVMHGGWYVSEAMAQQGRIGRSWGCPAVPKQMVKPIVDTIKNGNLVFAYYPDNHWLKQSKFLHCGISPITPTLS